MNNELGQIWQAAAGDLGIAVRIHGDAVVVMQFGSAAGMLCGIRATLEGERELQREAEAAGMAYSLLGSSYLTYDRDLFIGTLDDWGWFGNGSPPAWYTGEPWGA